MAAVVAGMKDVVENGLHAARHLRGGIYEVRADASTRSFRLLFSTEGTYGQVLLSLSAFEKRTQKTPPRTTTSPRRDFGTGGRAVPRRGKLQEGRTSRSFRAL